MGQAQAGAGLILTDLFPHYPLLPFRAPTPQRCLGSPACLSPPSSWPACHPRPRGLRGAMSCVLNRVVPLGLVLLVCGAQGVFLPNITQLEKLLSKYQQDPPHSRVRRAIPRSDREEILMLHNKLRGQVYPPASNMEYMVSAGAPGGGLGSICFCLQGQGVAGSGPPGQRGSPASVPDTKRHS